MIDTDLSFETLYKQLIKACGSYGYTLSLTANVYPHLDTERKRDIASSMSDTFSF